MESNGYGSGHLWGIVLAGGEGVRLRPLVREIFGDERPKQYAPLFGSASLLRQTLDRVARLIPPERTIIVSQQHHGAYMAREQAGPLGPQVLFQPQDRGTAAGILFPAYWIQQRDPEATVVVFPADHFIVEEAAFMAHAAAIAAFVDRNPERLVLVGAEPTEPEVEYGWMSPGESLGDVEGAPVCRVRGFVEKPDAETASACLGDGWLWNTMVFAVQVGTLIDTGRQLLPDLMDRLVRSAAFAGTVHSAWAIRQAYALAPKVNFSRAILQHCPPFLAVSRLPRLTWCDLGSPERVLRILKALKLQPPRMAVPDMAAIR
ncbi:MAG: NTP transferase domain-containing protein [Candidatus Rokubacteria bacterium]|nr:NTP transferase domain-containing protein [Candidatus Rokubacteria bacterium]